MKKIVSILGPSSAKKILFDEAERLGRLLVENGFSIQNGGYTGIMEASAKGAAEAGGKCHGILMDSNPNGNNYLTSSESLPVRERTDKLLSEDCIFFWSKESLGTQWEFLTALIAKRLELPEKKIIVICGGNDEHRIQDMFRGSEIIRVTFCLDAAEAVEELLK